MKSEVDMERLITWLIFTILTFLNSLNTQSVPVIMHVGALFFGLLLFYLTLIKKLKTGILVTLSVLLLLSGKILPQLLLYVPLVFFHLPLKPVLMILPIYLLLLPVLSGNLLNFLIAFFLCAFGAYLNEVTQKLIRLRRDHYKYTDESQSLLLSLRLRQRKLIEAQELHEQNRVLAERNRIAREIHDSIGHQITSAILQSRVFEMTSDNPELFTQLRNTLTEAMTDIRESIHRLHEESLSLRDALDGITDKVPLTVHTVIRYRTEPTPEIHYAILLFVKEALSNTMKHSNATQVRLRFQEGKSTYHLIIADNGTNIEKPKKEGIGLLSMEERAQSLSGTFHYNYENGFHIFIRIPIPRKEDT